MRRSAGVGTGGAMPAVAGLAVAASLALASCSGGLSRSEVEEMIHNEGGGLSRFEVEEIVKEKGGGLSRSEVEEIVRAAIAGSGEPSIPGEPRAEVPAPSKSDPQEYTKYFVDRAIRRYETEGLRATLDHYNDPGSVDGQWYGFIIDDDHEVIGHYDPSRRGNDLKGWVGTDANGYNFGAEMLLATEEGRWVTYVYQNPASSDAGFDPSGFELKRAWVVRHDGLLFGSGWYTNIDEFIKSQVQAAVETFRSGGIDELAERFADPSSRYGGIESTLAYYDSTDLIDGQWVGFVADPDGQVVSAALNPELLGENINDVLGVEVTGEATESGTWITRPSDDSVSDVSLRIWVANEGGMTFGGGWRDAAGS